jgi:hypothetical protein
LRLLQDFTGDVALLKAAVEKFNPQTSLEMQVENVAAVMPNLRDGDVSVGGNARVENLRLVFAHMAEFMNEQTKLALQDRVYRTAAALRLIASRLGGYPGRKNLIWVSAGFPIDVTSQVVQLTTDSDVLAQELQMPIRKFASNNLMRTFCASLRQTGPFTVWMLAAWWVQHWPTRAVRGQMKSACSRRVLSMAPMLLARIPRCRRVKILC